MINTYHRSIPKVAFFQTPLDELTKSPVKKNDKREIVWSPKSNSAFTQMKNNLAESTLLRHPSGSVKTCLVTHASDSAHGAALEQFFEKLSEGYYLLGFFSKKLSPAQTRYSTCDCELSAIEEAIKYFWHFLEGREFFVFMDHKPLIYAFKQRADKVSPR